MKDYAVGAQLLMHMRLAYLNPNKISTLEEATKYIRRYTSMVLCHVTVANSPTAPARKYQAQISFYEKHSSATAFESITRFGPSPQQATRNALISYLCYFRSQKDG